MTSTKHFRKIVHLLLPTLILPKLTLRNTKVGVGCWNSSGRSRRFWGAYNFKTACPQYRLMDERSFPSEKNVGLAMAGASGPAPLVLQVTYRTEHTHCYRE